MFKRHLCLSTVLVSGILMVCYGIDRLKNSLKQWKEAK